MNEKQDEVFKYLNELRESGATNMFGAGIYLQEEFVMTKKEAKEWVMKWMASFDD